MDPVLVNALINGGLAMVFAILKASGMTEEQAKADLQNRVANIEALPQLPMDIPPA